MHWHHWAFAGIGFWLILSPWVLGFSALNLPLWNNVLVGGLIVLLAFASGAPRE